MGQSETDSWFRRRLDVQLIIALDYARKEDALALVEQINPKDCALKVGMEMFTLFGPDFVRLLVKKNFKVFLDLKYHDIPNTVASACAAAAKLGVWMINVHVSGGSKMLEAAHTSIQSFGAQRPLLIGVTVLTSMTTTESEVLTLARQAKNAGLDGVVCSAHEVAKIKLDCGSDFLTITPGIRLSGDATHDQSRIMTPQQAAQVGTDYIVMGRSITQAVDPLAVIKTILCE